MRVEKQHVVAARLNGFKVKVGFLVKGAQTKGSALAKCQRYFDETGKPFTAVKCLRVATAADLELFSRYKDSVVGVEKG